MAKESTFKNMVVTLLTITLLSAAALGGVYVMTKDTIKQGKIKKVNDAIAQVVPAFDNNPSAEMIKVAIDGDTVKLYPAKMKGELVGMAVETFSKNGFSGLISLMVGFLPDGSIHDIAVIAHNETPGLGDKIEKKKSNFSVQFQGKNPETAKIWVKKDGGDIDAITASTISSRAYCDAVNRAYVVFLQQTKGEQAKQYDRASGAAATQGNDTKPKTDSINVNTEGK